MRYLRMLANSTAAAALGAAYVIAIVLCLHHLPLNPARLPPLVVTVSLFYVVHLTVIFYILLVVWQRSA